MAPNTSSTVETEVVPIRILLKLLSYLARRITATMMTPSMKLARLAVTIALAHSSRPWSIFILPNQRKELFF
jgi:hypothetical protein